MARYVKTEEGYKSLNEVEGNVALTAGDFIEVKDNTIRATFGDLISAVSEEILFNDIILGEDYYESIPGYQSEIGTYDTDPKVGDTYQIEITTISGIVSYGQGKVVPSDNGRYEVDFGNIYSTIRLAWIYNNVLVVRSSFNPLRGCSVKVGRLFSESKHVTLPKTALNYDDVPTENSDNLLTSGGIYDTVQNLQGQISSYDSTLQSFDNQISSLSITDSRLTHVDEYLQSQINEIKDLSDNGVNLKTITLANMERLYAKDLGAGIYKIDVPTGKAQVALGKWSTMTSGVNNLLILGGHFTEATAKAAGASYFDKSYVFLYTSAPSLAGSCIAGTFRGTKGDDGSWTYDIVEGGGAIETVNSKVTIIDDTSTADNTKYPSAKAVRDYVDNFLVLVRDYVDNSLVLEEEALHQIFDVTNNDSNMIVGGNLIELGAEYIVIFDGVEYRLPCVQGDDDIYIGNPYGAISDTNTYPFQISQTSNGMTNLYTTNAEHTCTLYKIDTNKIHVTDYVDNLKEKHDTEVEELRSLIEQLNNKVQALENSQPSTSGETIIDGTYTFELNEEMGGYILSTPVELNITNTEPYMEVYEVSLDNRTEEFALMQAMNEGVAFAAAETYSFMMYIPEGNQIIFMGDDIPNLSGEHKVVIKKMSAVNDPYVIRIADDGQLAWFILKDVVEGEATVRAVNQNQEELCTTKLNLKYAEPHFYSDFIYSGSGHEENMEAVFSALQAGDTVTIYITQMVDGEEITTTYGGIIPGYQGSSRYDNTPQYYWGNKYIPCVS